MDISSDYNSSSYPSSGNHRGICPAGWHLPSYAEWDALASVIASEQSCSNCDAKHLKAASGWNNCAASGSSYSCMDTYGFAALPGGYGYSDGDFGNAGIGGIWWSASETNAYGAYSRYMSYDTEYAYWDYYGKADLFSVRCLQD